MELVNLLGKYNTSDSVSAIP